MEHSVRSRLTVMVSSLWDWLVTSRITVGKRGDRLVDESVVKVQNWTGICGYLGDRSED